MIQNNGSMFIMYNPDQYIPSKKILEFRSLEKGWRYGEGGPIPEDIIQKAVLIEKTAFEQQFFETDAFPGVNGEIMLTIYYEKHCFEFTIETNGTITFVHEFDNDEIAYEENVAFDEALKKISNLMGEIWKLSGRFIRENGTQSSKDLEVWHSRILQEEVSQLLISAA